MLLMKFITCAFLCLCASITTFGSESAEFLDIKYRLMAENTASTEPFDLTILQRLIDRNGPQAPDALATKCFYERMHGKPIDKYFQALQNFAKLPSGGWNTSTVKTAKILVIIPKTRTQKTLNDGQATNRAVPIPGGKISLTTDTKRSIRISFQDQFGNILDAMYNGNRVVTEEFSNPRNGKFFNIPAGAGAVPISIPTGDLMNGVLDDECGAIGIALIGVTLPDTPKNRNLWEKTHGVGTALTRFPPAAGTPPPITAAQRQANLDAVRLDLRGDADMEVKVHGHKGNSVVRSIRHYVDPANPIDVVDK